MRIVIPAYLRSGSTWVEHILHLLLGLEKFPIDFGYTRVPGVRISVQERDVFNQLPSGIYRTHSLTPTDCLPLLDLENFYLVTVRRDLLDTLVSQIKFFRYKTPIHDRIKNFNTDWQMLPDHAYVNLFIEANLPLVNQELIRWNAFQGEVWASNSITLSYERLCKDLVGEVKRLANVFNAPLSQEKLDQILEETQPHKIQEISGDSKFVTSGAPGAGNLTLDEGNILRVENFVKQLNAKK